MAFGGNTLYPNPFDIICPYFITCITPCANRAEGEVLDNKRAARRAMKNSACPERL